MLYTLCDCILHFIIDGNEIKGLLRIWKICIIGKWKREKGKNYLNYGGYLRLFYVYCIRNNVY